MTRPVDDDIIRYESVLEFHEPFGVLLEDGKKMEKDLEKTLDSVEKTCGKLHAVSKVAEDIDEELEKYGTEGTVARSFVVHRKKHLDEIKENIEKKKDTVEAHVVELEEFLTESDDMKSWSHKIKEAVDKVCYADEGPENAEKQLNEVEVSWPVKLK